MDKNIITYMELTKDTCEQYETIHKNFFNLSGYNRRRKTFEACALTNASLSNFKRFKIYDDLITLINDTKELLLSNNITNFNGKKFYVEFQRANLPELNHNRTVRKIPMHFDDYGAISYPVWTIIYYVRKDNGIKGGNFEYRPDFGNLKTNTINVQTSSILIFPGDIYHSSEKMYGFGCRDFILVQFART
jgi:hypothetical protein